MAVSSMTDLLHRASNTILSKASIISHDYRTPAGNVGADYEWLYKDAPRCPKDGGILMILDGYVDIEISINAGRFRSPPILNPVSLIYRIADQVASDSSWPFLVTAKLGNKGEWPLELGFRRLGEFIAFVAHEGVPCELWKYLEIELPDIELPYDPSATAITIPLEDLKNLRQLKWTGHRHQLSASWLPFTPSFLQLLTDLHLICNLTLRDCTYILSHGTSLKKVIFDRIYKGFADEPILPFEPSGGYADRPCLESLTLTSDDDIGPLMEPFRFTSLHHITFHLSYPTMFTFYRLGIWKTIQTGSIDCFITEQDRRWILDQCPPTSKLYLGGAYGTLSGSNNGVPWERIRF
ncbi:hypothetical protein H0H87_002698 [Tephrocybe sp. NHM501043]|nr:hypothetical protein H0H87_002698 [Tephrocybe sp. NHM501043]